MLTDIVKAAFDEMRANLRLELLKAVDDKIDNYCCRCRCDEMKQFRYCPSCGRHTH